MKRLLLMTIAVFALAPAAAQADSCASTGDGAWTDAIWSCGHTPINGDAVTITHNVNVTTNSAASSVSLTAGILSVNNAIFTVPTVTVDGGNLQLNNGGTVIGNVSADDSSIFMSGSTYVFGNVTLTNEAMLSGFGAVTNLFNDSGVVRPGDNGVPNTPGTIRVGNATGPADSYTQGSDGVLELSIVGPNAGEFDSLEVNQGTASLDGLLDISRQGVVLTNASLPLVTTTGGRTGSFSSISGLGIDGADIFYTTNNVMLLGPPPVPFVPPAIPAVPISKANPNITVPSSRKCQKSVSIKINPSAGTTIASSSIKAGSKKVKTKTTNGIVTAKFRLKKKKTKVSVTGTTNAGTKFSVTKTYKRCK